MRRPLAILALLFLPLPSAPSAHADANPSASPCDTAYFDQAGESVCVPSAPGIPTDCAYLSGGATNDCSELNDVERRRPMLRVFADDHCDPAQSRSLLRWSSRAQTDDPSRPGAGYRVYRGVTLILNTVEVGRGSFVDTPGVAAGSSYDYRLEYNDNDGIASTPFERIQFQGCAAPDLTTVGQNPSGTPGGSTRSHQCPPRVAMNVLVDERDGQRAGNLRSFVLTRAEAGGSTVPIFVPHDSTTTSPSGAATNHRWTDNGVQSYHQYRWTAQADYGVRGHAADPTASNEVAVGPCPPPRVRDISSESSLPPSSAGGNNRREASILVGWEWDADSPLLQSWIDHVALYRRSEPRDPNGPDRVDTNYHPNAPDDSEWNNPTLEQLDPNRAPGQLVARIPLRAASNCQDVPFTVTPGLCGYSYRDDTIFGSASYRYQVVAVPRQEARLYSNTAATYEERAPPWPPEEVTVRTMPQYRPAAQTPGPDDAFYAEDLQDRPDKYGIAEVSWRRPATGPRPDEVEFRFTYEGRTHTCRFPFDGPLDPPILFPDDFDRPGFCANADPLPKVLGHDTEGHRVEVYLHNEDGRSLPAVVDGISSWSSPTTPPDTRSHSDPAKAGDPEPSTRRTFTLGRTDRVVHHQYQSRTYPLGNAAIIPGGHIHETHAHTDWQPPTVRDVPGTPCAAATLLQVWTLRQNDQRSIGIDTPILDHVEPLENTRVSFHALNASFESLLDVDKPELGHVRAATYLARHALTGPPIHAPYDVRFDDGAYQVTTKWTEVFADNLWATGDGYPPDFVGPRLPGRPLPRLPFNAQGFYCWVDHLLLLGENPHVPFQRVATFLDLGTTHHEFHHDLQETHDRRFQNVGQAPPPGATVCKCVPHIRDDALQVHLLKQSWASRYNRYAELRSVGLNAPLAGAAAFWYGDKTGAADLAGADYGKFEPVLEPRLDNELLTLTRTVNQLVGPREFRWDVADTAPPPHLALGTSPEARYVLFPWLEIRPNLGAQDRGGQWYVPGNFAPVAYVGGIVSPFEGVRKAHNWRWTFEYDWQWSTDGDEWTRVPGTTYPFQTPPATQETYEAGHGALRWRVRVYANLTGPDETPIERVVLDDEQSFRLDRWSLLDAQTNTIGTPILKRDESPLGDPLMRGSWYTFPDQTAPWETLQRPDNRYFENIYRGRPGLSLTRGHAMLQDLSNALEVEPLDPIFGWGSAERPYPDENPDPSEEEVAQLRANDTFLQFAYNLDPDAGPDDAPILTWRLYNMADLAMPLFGFQDPDRPGYAAPDLTYPVDEGDELWFALRITPTTTLGRVKTTSSDVPPTYDESWWQDTKEWFGADDTEGEKEWKSTIRRSRVSLTAEYAEPPGSGPWEQEHAAAINRWSFERVPLTPGKHLTHINVRTKSYVDPDLDAGNQVHVFYVDQVLIHSPKKGRDFALFDHRLRFDPRLELLPAPWTSLEGDKSYATRLVRIEPPSTSPDGTSTLDPANPFIRVIGLKSVRDPTGYGSNHQPLLVAGLQVGAPAPGYDPRTPAAPDARYSSRPDAFYQTLDAGPAGDRAVGLLRPAKGNYWQQYKIDPVLRFDDPGDQHGHDRSDILVPYADLDGRTPGNGQSLNHRGMAQLRHVYSYTDLLNPHHLDTEAPDYLNYSAGADARVVTNVDGTRTYLTNVPLLVDAQPLAAAPIGPFWDVPPVILTAENALRIDLNEANVWDSKALRDRIAEGFQPGRDAWVEIEPYPSRLDACYRYDPNQPWRNVEELAQDKAPLPGQTLYVRVQLVVWQNTTEELAKVSPDPCVQPHSHDPPNLILEHPSTELQRHASLDLYYIVHDPTATAPTNPMIRKGERLVHRTVSSFELDRSNGVYQFQFATTRVPSFTVLNDDPEFHTRSSRLVVGREIMQGEPSTGTYGVGSVVLAVALAVGLLRGIVALGQHYHRRIIDP